MVENCEKSKLLLFLCAESAEDGGIASSLFENEAKKMDVMWTSQSKVLSAANENIAGDPASLDDLLKADLVIVLQKAGSKSDLKSLFSAWTGKNEVWEIPDQTDVHTAISQNIGSLLVRLILQGGKRKPTPGQSVTNQRAANQNSANLGKQSDGSSSNDAVRVSRESKGRRGKTVTIISGLTLDEAKLQELSTRLKQLCGTGGTVKGGRIEIQGDQCDRILAELHNRGFKAKRSGG
jgi:translation initiation factor 1